MKKSVWIVPLLLILILPMTVQAAPVTDNSYWIAEYYPNSSLSGSPTVVVRESELAHDWGSGAPDLDIPADNFSARWTGTRYFEPGTYLIALTVDDGARVWLDGQLIIDAWNLGYKGHRSQKVRFERAGNHEIQVAYFEKRGYATIFLEEIRLGGPQDMVGNWSAEYFNNRYLKGEPELRREDPTIDFNWDTESPHSRLARDNFSVRWTRNIYLTEGSHTLRLRHDDGMRIYIDGELVYNSWEDQPSINKTQNIKVSDGFHEFVIEYYDHLDIAVAEFDIYQ